MILGTLEGLTVIQLGTLSRMTTTDLGISNWMIATEFETLREILSKWGHLNRVMATGFGTVKGMMVNESGT